MKSEHGGLFPGLTSHERAVEVAGFLAERGIQSVTIVAPVTGDSVTVVSRATDLPAVLCARSCWVLEADGALIQGTPVEIRWTTTDDATANTLRSIRRRGC